MASIGLLAEIIYEVDSLRGYFFDTSNRGSLQPGQYWITGQIGERIRCEVSDEEPAWIDANSTCVKILRPTREQSEERARKLQLRLNLMY